jgi:hypothetical protein
MISLALASRPSRMRDVRVGADVQHGRAVRGSATAPQPAFEVREDDRRIHVRLPGPG